MKKIYFILVVLWLSVSSVSAQNALWGKTYKYNLDANTMVTYSVDKVGNAEYTISIMRNNAVALQIRLPGKDKSTKKMLWAKLDENFTISMPDFQGGKFLTLEEFAKVAGRLPDKLIAQTKGLAKLVNAQIVNITEDEIRLLTDISGYESTPCKTIVFTLVK